jgi:hypothetical protein
MQADRAHPIAIKLSNTSAGGHVSKPSVACRWEQTAAPQQAAPLCRVRCSHAETGAIQVKQALLCERTCETPMSNASPQPFGEDGPGDGLPTAPPCLVHQLGPAAPRRLQRDSHVRIS